jgi:hypothetical protein
MEKHKEGKFLTTKAQKSKKERRIGDLCIREPQVRVRLIRLRG